MTKDGNRLTDPLLRVGADQAKAVFSVPCKQWDGRFHPITAWMCHGEGFPHHASNRSLHMEIKTIGIDQENEGCCGQG